MTTNALEAGTLIHQYRIETVLGAGSFGITYKAQHDALGYYVAIKEYFPTAWAYRDPDGITVLASASGQQPISDKDDTLSYEWGRDRFLQEARTLHAIKHDGVVTIRDFFPANETAYLVMDFEAGESLAERLERTPDSTLPESELQPLLEQMLDALDAVHAQGYLHRDLKPDNLYLRERDGRLMLIDFGAARQAIGNNSLTLTNVLTPGYAPIEQYSGKAEQQGPQTDLYAVGAILYRCITGVKPAEVTDRLTVNNDPLESAADIAKERYSQLLLTVVDKCLYVMGPERFQTVAEMRAALVPTIKSETSPPKPESTIVYGQQSNAYGLWLGLLGLIVLIGVGYWFWQPHIQEPVEPTAAVTTTTSRLEPKPRPTEDFYIPDLRFERTLEPEQTPEPTVAALTVVPTPADAKVRILNIRPVYQEGIELKPGDYQIEVSREGYETHQQSYALAAGEQTLRIRLTTLPEFPVPEMVFIEGGEFLMGSPESEAGRDSDERQHNVKLDDFFIGRYEVTVEQFRAFVEDTGYETEAEKDNSERKYWYKNKLILCR